MQRTRAPSTLVTLVPFIPLLCGACGVLFTHGPPPDHGNLTTFGCTRSAAAPMLDVAFATLSMGMAVKDAANQDLHDTHETNQALVGGVLEAAIWGVSAAIGFDRVRKCAAAMRQLGERQAQAPGGGGTRVYGLGVETVAITPVADTLLPGEHVQLVANAFTPSGGVFLNKMFRWSSSNAAVASISDSGLVTAHAPGTVVIAANTDNVVGTASIVVISAR